MREEDEEEAESSAPADLDSAPADDWAVEMPQWRLVAVEQSSRLARLGSPSLVQKMVAGTSQRPFQRTSEPTTPEVGSSCRAPARVSDR